MRRASRVAAMVIAPVLLYAQAPADAQLERNKEIVRRHFAAVNRHESAGTWATSDVRNNGVPLPPDLRRLAGGLFQMYPDWHVDIDELIAEGDTVVVRYRASGTHKGVAKLPYGGMPVGTPPTGKRFENYRHIHIYKMRDRKFVDHYPARHDVEMLQQLGLLPANFGPPRGGGGVRQGGAGTPATAAAVHAEVASPTATREELERNKAVVRAHLEKTNRGDVEGMLQDFADRDIRNNGRPVAGREYFRAALEDLFRAIPDWRVEIDELVAEGDTVAVRYRASGTHTGVTNYGMNMLPAGQPPTRKRFAGYRHIHIYKLRDGKLVDHYPARDDLGLLRQLGLLPAGFGKQTFPTR